MYDLRVGEVGSGGVVDWPVDISVVEDIETGGRVGDGSPVVDSVLAVEGPAVTVPIGPPPSIHPLLPALASVNQAVLGQAI